MKLYLSFVSKIHVENVCCPYLFLQCLMHSYDERLKMLWCAVHSTFDYKPKQTSIFNY